MQWCLGPDGVNLEKDLPTSGKHHPLPPLLVNFYLFIIEVGLPSLDLEVGRLQKALAGPANTAIGSRAGLRLKWGYLLLDQIVMDCHGLGP